MKSRHTSLLDRKERLSDEENELRKRKKKKKDVYSSCSSEIDLTLTSAFLLSRLLAAADGERGRENIGTQNRESQHVCNAFTTKMLGNAWHRRGLTGF